MTAHNQGRHRGVCTLSPWETCVQCVWKGAEFPVSWNVLWWPETELNCRHYDFQTTNAEITCKELIKNELSHRVPLSPMALSSDRQQVASSSLASCRYRGMSSLSGNVGFGGGVILSRDHTRAHVRHSYHVGSLLP
jgi:hypothetical protein